MIVALYISHRLFNYSCLLCFSYILDPLNAFVSLFTFFIEILISAEFFYIFSNFYFYLIPNNALSLNLYLHSLILSFSKPLSLLSYGFYARKNFVRRFSYPQYLY
jgi:hypothetical protein